MRFRSHNKEPAKQEEQSYIATLLTEKYPIGRIGNRVRVGYNLRTADDRRVRISGKPYTSEDGEKNWLYVIRHREGRPRFTIHSMVVDGSGQASKVEPPPPSPLWYRITPNIPDAQVLASFDVKAPDVNDIEQWVAPDPNDLKELYSSLALAREVNPPAEMTTPATET